MSELKRCPFCGDEVEIVPTGLYHWKYAIRHKSKTECILDANAFALPYEKAEAVRMWNTRAEEIVTESQTENLYTDKYGDVWEWRGDAWYCISGCETCKHRDEEWDSKACDGCCENNDHYDPQTERSE